MLSDEIIERVTERLASRIEQGNEYILKTIGESIKKVGTLTPSKAQELVQIMRYGGDYDKIVKKLAEITKLNVKDIYKIFEEVAKENYLFAEQFYKYRNKNYIPWDENIDEGLEPTNDNTIDEVVFEVAKLYTFINSEDGVITSASILETIKITDKFVGFIRYKDGFDLNAYDGGCDSHFVAFSTDKPIDKLYEAEVYYTAQDKRFTAVYTVGGGSEYSYGSVEEEYAYLDYKQNASYETDGLGGRKYSWKRINSVDGFMKEVEGTNIFSVAMFDVFDEETFTDVAETNLKSKQWVLRFAETDYKDVYTSAMRDISKTSVGDVTVLRLKFETDGNVYDLPVIDNKQTGSENSATEHNYELKLNDTFKILLMLILILILAIVLGPILPTIINIVLWVIKTVFKIAIWIISLPFKLFKKRE